MNKLTSKIKLPFDSLKETSWSAILFFSVLYCIYVTFINLVVFKSDILAPISRYTSGLINQTLIVNIFSILVFVFIIIIKCGKLSLSDIGFKKNRLLSAIVAVLVLWFSLQIINLIFGIITSGKPIVFNGWNKFGATKMFGSLISQIFGNSLFEELAFRGFLLVQICKKLKSVKFNLYTKVIVSQLLFAVIHIPNRILSGMNILEILPSLIIVLALGVLFATIYLLTDNLFLVVGIHALWNMPLLVFDGLISSLYILIATILLLIIWDKTFGRLDSKPDKVRTDLEYRL